MSAVPNPIVVPMSVATDTLNVALAVASNTEQIAMGVSFNLYEVTTLVINDGYQYDVSVQGETLVFARRE